MHILFVHFLVMLSSPLAFSATLHVPTEYLTIQAGINATAVGDTVFLAPGLYNGDGNRDLDFNGKDITVRSEDNNPATCTIACQASYPEYHRGFIFQSGESSLARLEGITISGGSSGWEDDTSSGGGILCLNGSSPTIKNCRVTHCVAGNIGGGLAAIDSSPTIRDCRFDHNDAPLGGGVGVRGETQFIMTGSQIMNNSGYDGGGVYLRGWSSFLSECVIANNEADGIYAEENCSITYSTIIGNYIVKTAGMHEAFWNGRDHAGRRAAAGVFLYVLTTSGGRDVGRMALIK